MKEEKKNIYNETMSKIMDLFEKERTYTYRVNYLKEILERFEFSINRIKNKIRG